MVVVVAVVAVTGCVRGGGGGGGNRPRPWAIEVCGAGVRLCRLA